MTKGNDIPYQLRPNKFIDRQIFLDLIQRIVAINGAEKYVYISMGGKHLVDHESIYRRVGIKNLYSFDSEDWVIERQQKNRPNEAMICQALLSSSLSNQLDDLLELFDDAENFIIWLDYTRPKDRLNQLQELTEVLKRCQPGDLVRITMNADAYGFRGRWKDAGFSDHASYRADKLKQQIGHFYPNKVQKIVEHEIPQTIATSISLAASKAEKSSKYSFTPVLGTTYADGQRMVTIAILVVEKGANAPSSLTGWEFMPSSWDQLLDISAPDLSMKEKIYIDQHLEKGEAEIIENVGFQPAELYADALRAIASYKQLHRYYPSFYAIGIQ